MLVKKYEIVSILLALLKNIGPGKFGCYTWVTQPLQFVTSLLIVDKDLISPFLIENVPGKHNFKKDTYENLYP